MIVHNPPEYIREPGGPTSIDLSKMPRAAARRMGNALLNLAKVFFEDPENRRQCEEWKAAQSTEEMGDAYDP